MTKLELQKIAQNWGIRCYKSWSKPQMRTHIVNSLQHIQEKLSDAVEHNRKWSSSYVWSFSDARNCEKYAELQLTQIYQGRELSIKCKASPSRRYTYYSSTVTHDGVRTTFRIVNKAIKQCGEAMVELGYALPKTQTYPQIQTIRG